TSAGQLVVEQEVVVEAGDFNQPIADSVFTLPGVGVSSGTPIELPGVADRGKQPTWQSGQIDRNYTREKQAADVYNGMSGQVAPVPDETNVPPRRGWIYYALAACLAVCGVVLLWKTLVRR